MWARCVHTIQIVWAQKVQTKTKEIGTEKIREEKRRIE